MASCQEKLLKEFEEFELNLEVEDILKKVKEECVLDPGVVEFGEKLKERESQKQAAQAVRELEVEEKWSPGHYPQLTTDWFIEGLDYCCGYWRYQFKRPLTPRQYRHHRPMPPRRCSNRRRSPANYRESDDDVAPHDTDDDYDPHDDADDDVDYELADLRAKQAPREASQVRYRVRHPDRVAASQERYLAKRKSKAHNMRAKCKRYRVEQAEKVAAYKKWYRETHRDFIAESKKRYREENRARVAESKKRYRERYPDRVAESYKRYREKNRARVAESKKRYRERYPDRVAESYKRYREKNRARVAEAQKHYQERHPDRVAETQKRYNEKRRERYQKHVANNEKKRTREKLNALGPLKLTISLVDYLKSPSGHTPVTTYVRAFCDSLESADTNESPAESFVQLLEGDSHTLIDLDSGAIQVREPPECDLDDLSFLQDLLKDMSPDDWQQVMDDVEESSFDLEPLLPPDGIVDLFEDMSPDEGVDLMYDLVS